MAGVDMSHIAETFNSSLINDDDIDLSYYLSAYEELYRLCSLLGTIFGFVASEIMSKMNILRELKKNDVEGHFNTMKRMVTYERDLDLLYKPNEYVSGSRTLLRLHRGLAFISLFFTKVNQLDMEDSTSSAGTEAYEQTLYPHHSWFVSSSASIALKFLPSKQNLLNRVCGNNINECLKSLPRMLEVLELVYNRMEQYYGDNRLLDLP